MSNESKSTGWNKEGALWTYHKPESREDRHTRVIRQNAEIRKGWLERHPELEQCPECSSGNYGTTLMGGQINEEHYHDPNRKTCADCGHVWKAPCPTCGEVAKL